MASPRSIDRATVIAGGTAIVLTPYATLALPFRRALVVQATVVLGLTLALCARGAWNAWRDRKAGRPWRDRLRAASPGLLAGVALWAGAALLGAGVGLARGNDPRLVVGQLLAMGLLPLGAVGSLALSRRVLAPALAAGIVLGTSLAALLHFGHWAFALASGRLVERLYLTNSVAAVGTVLMALLAAAALFLMREGAVRLLAAAAVVLLATYVVGSGVRSLWLVAPGACILFAGLVWMVPVLRRRVPRTAWITLVVGPLAIAFAGLALVREWQEPRMDLMDEAFPAPRPPRPDVDSPPGDDSPDDIPPIRWRVSQSRSLGLTDRVVVTPELLYRGRAQLRGKGRGRCLLVLDWLGEDGALRGRSRSPLVFPDGRVQVAEAVGVASAGTRTAQARLTCELGSHGVWDVLGVRLEQPGGRIAGLLAVQTLHLARRVDSISEIGELTDPISGISDVSFALRFEESRALWREIRSGGPLTLFFGRGLGATYLPVASSKERTGEAAAAEPVNYAHNFYLFLPFKLGLVGAAAVLLALALFVTRPLREVFGRFGGTADRQEVAAWAAWMVAAWMGQAVWSVACPLWIDFRVAPLWGLLVAASAFPGVAQAEGRGPSLRRWISRNQPQRPKPRRQART